MSPTQITAAALTSAGRILVTAESDNIYVWSFPHRAILSASPEPDVAQVSITADERRFLTTSHKQAPGTAPSMLVVCRTIPLGDVVYTFEFSVKKFLPIGNMFEQ